MENMTLTDQTGTSLKEAQELFGIESQQELDELVSSFQDVLLILQQWDSASSN